MEKGETDEIEMGFCCDRSNKRRCRENRASRERRGELYDHVEQPESGGGRGNGEKVEIKIGA